MYPGLEQGLGLSWLIFDDGSHFAVIREQLFVIKDLVGVGVDTEKKLIALLTHSWQNFFKGKKKQCKTYFLS